MWFLFSIIQEIWLNSKISSHVVSLFFCSKFKQANNPPPNPFVSFSGMCRGVCLLGFSSKQSNSKQPVVVAETEQAIRRRSGSKRAICCSASKQAIRCLTDERAISCSIDEQASKWASNPSFWKGAGKGGAHAGRQAGGKEEGEGKEAGGWGIYLCCVNRALFCREKRKKERKKSQQGNECSNQRSAKKGT